MLSLEDMSAPVLRLAGIRFNPFTLLKHGPHSPELYYTALALQDVKSGEKHAIPLPENARINHISWSPDGSRVAFTVRTAEIGVEAVPKIHILDASTGSVTKLEQPVNAVLGAPFTWLPCSSKLIVRRPIGTHADAPSGDAVPSSPSMQEAAGGGQKAAVRTYPNLLTSAEDAAAFRHYATVQLVEVSVSGGERLIGPPCLNYHATASPDGSTLLTHSLRPDHLSYAVPWSRFGRQVELLPLAPDGAAATLQVAPVVEAMPIGHDACRAGPRQYAWRPDQPAMIYYVEALDGGDPKVKPAEGKRDKVMLLSAPYTCPHELCRTATRYQHARWTAGGTALVWERWYKVRTTIISKVAPGGAMEQLMTYDFSDGYNHPGAPLLEEGPYGRSVLRIHDGDALLWEGGGGSPDGARPFLDVRGFADGVKRSRLWRAAKGCYDDPLVVVGAAAARQLGAADDASLLIFSRRQTQTQPPQLLLRAVTATSAAAADADGADDASVVLSTLSDPPHPQPALLGAKKELIKYERDDGVALTGTLHTPAGWTEADGPLPTILWAYPREFKSKASASQVRGSEHTFTMVGWGSPLFWLARGYAVLEGFAVPIVAEGEDAHENDNYVEQLKSSAEAAVGELRKRGVSDHRLAVGGHSYGAFMTANLLARAPDLFCAGIARNGAFNRSLTPFGFQAEERSFWEAQQTYAEMSPFFVADKIKTPLLLIHGAEDPNPGTFPMQSERLFAALKGLGATARLVLLPKEGHWYRARENVMHTLAEQDAWLEKYVRNAPPRSVEADCAQ